MMPLRPSPASSAPITIGLLSVTVSVLPDLDACDADEGLGVEGRTTHEQPVDAGKVRDRTRVCRVDAAAVEHGRSEGAAGGEPAMDPGVHGLDVLGRRGHGADADR